MQTRHSDAKYKRPVALPADCKRASPTVSIPNYGMSLVTVAQLKGDGRSHNPSHTAQQRSSGEERRGQPSKKGDAVRRPNIREARRYRTQPARNGTGEVRLAKGGHYSLLLAAKSPSYRQGSDDQACQGKAHPNQGPRAAARRAGKSKRRIQRRRQNNGSTASNGQTVTPPAKHLLHLPVTQVHRIFPHKPQQSRNKAVVRRRIMWVKVNCGR